MVKMTACFVVDENSFTVELIRIMLKLSYSTLAYINHPLFITDVLQDARCARI